MSFVHGALAAAGFACVAIPIIIHLLFRQRRKPMAWAAMRFLLEAMRRQRRRLRLETLILLAVRCLLVACLAAAIARPMLGRAGLLGGSSGRDLYLLVDNSLASSARGDDGRSALDRHKQTAGVIADSLGAGDRLGLLTLASPAEGTVVPATSDARAVKALVNDLSASDSAADLGGALDKLGTRVRSDRAGAGSSATRPVGIVVLSDFVLGSCDVSRPLPPVLQGLVDVSLSATTPGVPAPGNVQVTGVEPLRGVVLGGGTGAEASQVRVSLRRTGSTTAQAGVTTVRLLTGDRTPRGGSGGGDIGGESGRASVRWNAGQTEATVTVQVDNPEGAAGALSGGARASGERVLTVQIDRDAVEGDNIRRRVIELRDRLQVGVVAQRTFGAAGRVDRLGSADWFRLALRPGESAPVEVVDIEPSAVDAASLSGLDAVVMPAPDQVKDRGWQHVRRFAESGGLVLVSPPEGVTVHLWADQFTRAMGVPWRIAREATEAGESAQRLADLGASDGAGTDGSTIFALLSPELKELKSPVSVSRWLKVEDQRAGARSLLRLANGDAWLLAARAGDSEGESAGRGLVVLLASAPVLSWTDLPARPMMVPLVQEIVRQGVGEAGSALSLSAGRGLVVPAGTREIRTMVESAGPERLIIDATVASLGQVRNAGVWRAVDDAGRSRGLVVVNADVDAGRLDAQAPDAVRAWLGGAFGSAFAQGDRAGSPGGGASVSWFDPTSVGRGSVWSASGSDHPMSAWTLPLFVAALVLATLELFLARWFSHATVPAGGVGESGVAPGLEEVLGAASPSGGESA